MGLPSPPGKMHVSCSVVSDSAILWLSPASFLHLWGVSRQENWSGLPFPSPGDLPNPGIEPMSPAPQADFFYHLSHQGSSLGTME